MQSAQTVSDEVAFTEEEEDKVSEILEETDMTDLIGKLVAASKARGIEVSDSDAREFIASMAAARLIIVKDSDLIFEFGNAVADAFGGKHFYEADAFSRSTDLITNEKSIDLRPTEDALLTSAAHPERVYILTLAPSVKERFEILKPFGDYFSYPKGRDRIKFATADGEKTCQLSSGVWVITTIDDMLFDEIPSYISKNAVFSSLTLTAAEESKGKIECPVILPEQFENSVASLSKRSSLSEENWKKIDEFLDYASSLVDFSLGNRGFLALERYFSIMLENGNDETSALDLAVAHALLPRFISAVRESSAIVDENILDVLERIFGENDVAACEEVIGRSLMLGIKGAGRLGDE